MYEKKYKLRRGFTLIEVMMTVLAAIILVIGISGILAAGHRRYNDMFKRVNSEVVRNSYEARSIFDNIVRKCVDQYPSGLSDSTMLHVYYYSDPSNLATLNNYPDRYALFYKSGSELKLQLGTINNWPPATPSPGSGDRIIATNVSAVEFTIQGASVRMSLTLDNKNDPKITDILRTVKLDVTTTAIRHNRLPEH